MPPVQRVAAAVFLQVSQAVTPYLSLFPDSSGIRMSTSA